jgi:hypothetical protein
MPRVLTGSLLNNTERDAALEELKVYGRDPTNADPIFTKEVRMSCKAFDLARH